MRQRKRFVISFATAFVIKHGGKDHWLPAAPEGLLFMCMNKLVKDTYLESTRSRLRAVKLIYFNGDPRRSKGPLPRIRVRDADRPEAALERVSAFLGWRFPSTIDTAEMDVVKKWLRDNENILKVSIQEATEICFGIFSRYTKCSNKYVYSGYPMQLDSPPGPAERSRTTQAESNHQTDVNLNSDRVVAGVEPVSDEPSEQRPVEGTRARLLRYAEEIMKVAKNDVFYRSLKLALTPSGNVRFNVFCTVWTSTFDNGQVPDEWCGLQKDIFEFCRLTAHGETNTPRYAQLKLEFSDQLEAFKLVRSSASLPLYEEEPSSSDEESEEVQPS